MKLLLRDENGIEEVLAEDDYYIPGLFLGGLGVMSHIVIFVWDFTLRSQIFWLFFTSPLILSGIFMIISDRKTTVIDRSLYKVIIDSHLISILHRIEEINFSDIEEVKVTYSYGEYSWFCYTDLITTQGKSIRLKSSIFEDTSDSNKENAKWFGIKICDLIGVNGQHIDINGKLTLLNCNRR